MGFSMINHPAIGWGTPFIRLGNLQMQSMTSRSFAQGEKIEIKIIPLGALLKNRAPNHPSLMFNNG